MPTTTFGPTGRLAYFEVPAECASLAVLAAGAAGVAVTSYEINAGVSLAGGRGALVRARISVTPGERLWIAVATAPSNSRPGTASANGAGFAAGGSPGAGAATIIGRGTVALANAIVIAGGGGAGGEDGTGGDAGGIGGRSAGTGGGGLGGGQDPTYTSSEGEGTTLDGCGAGGGGLVGGRAGALANDRRGGGGGGSSKLPSGATVTAESTGPGRVELTFGLAPYAPRILAPLPGDVLAAGRQARLVWQHAGADPADAQVAAEVVVTSAAGTFTYSLDDDSEQLLQPVVVQAGSITWTVRTRSQGSTWGETATTTFAAGAAPPDPVITSPASGSVATTAQLTLTWTASDQGAYRVRRLSADGARVLSDTGIVPAAAARSVTLTLEANRRTEQVALSVRGAFGVWSREVATTVTTAWRRPAVPRVTVTAEDATGSLVITVEHPVEGGRPIAVTEELEVSCAGREGRHPIETDVDAFGVRRWRLPASDVDYVVVVTARDAVGVPAVGVSLAEPAGWGRGPWGAPPWGS